MKTQSIPVLAMVCVLSVANVASATIVRGIDIDFVTIGNVGNLGDTRAEANPSGCGAVGYEYQIGKYEVTNAQWNAFTLAAGAPTGNSSYPYNSDAYWTGTNVPTNNVSWYEAAQFCNYLTSGDKSQGAYQFSGNNTNPGDFLGIDRGLSVSAYGVAYVIPTEDEWYKAAYYTGSGYSTYANGEESIPAADNGWNYYGGLYNSPWDVGSGTEEQNVTFDIMGNVWEWNETQFGPGSHRSVRGGSYGDIEDGNFLRSSYRLYDAPYAENFVVGFRVASVPEPCSLIFLSLGGLALLRKRRAVVRRLAFIPANQVD